MDLQFSEILIMPNMCFPSYLYHNCPLHESSITLLVILLKVGETKLLITVNGSSNDNFTTIPCEI